MRILADTMETGNRCKGRCGSGVGNKEVWAGVAVMVMPAGEMIARLILIVGHAAMMIGMIGVIVIAVVHGIDGKIAQTNMVVRDHQRRSVLDLISRFGGQRCHIEHQQCDAERGHETVQSGGDRLEHGPACNCAALA